MTRFLVLFSALFLIAAALMATVLAQNGYSLLDTKMTSMWFVVVLVALYVAWRIDGILRRRSAARGEDSVSGSKPGGFGAFTAKPSSQHAARAARVAAKRKKLIAEGKLEEAPKPQQPAGQEETSPPTRVSQSAPIKDRMAARAERVRRAKEQGKL